jgi:hypothetical protein
MRKYKGKWYKNIAGKSSSGDDYSIILDIGQEPWAGQQGYVKYYKITVANIWLKGAAIATITVPEDTLKKPVDDIASLQIELIIKIFTTEKRRLLGNRSI